MLKLFIQKKHLFISKLFIISAVIFFLVAIFIGLFYTLANPYWSDGDEVHYLIMTNSFIVDKDFNLQNNYESREYFSHHGSKVDPHVVISPIDGSQRSWHNFLLPVIISPGYYAMGIKGARIMYFFICLLGLLLSIKLIKSIGFSWPVSIFTSAIFALQMPILLYSQYIYTDMLAGYFLLAGGYFLYSMLKKKKLIYLLPASIIFGLTLFLHIKLLLIISLLLIFSILCYLYLDKKFYRPNKIQIFKIISLLSPFAILFLAFCWVQYKWFGVFSYDAAFKVINSSASLNPFEYLIGAVGKNPLRYLIGLFFDGEYGLFINAPILLLTLPGFYLIYKKSRGYFFSIVIPTIIFMLIHSTYIEWRTWGPPARYTIAILPLLLPLLAVTINALSKKIWTLILLIAIALFSLIPTLGLFFYRTYNRGGYPSNEPINYYWKLSLKYLNLPNIQKLWYVDMIYNPASIWYILGYALFAIMLILCGYLLYQLNLEVNKKESMVKLDV